jgi:hypothetical protein
MKYLVVYHGLDTVVPESLREFVKKTISDEFNSFDLELDFSSDRTGHDLTVTFSNEIPGWPVYGESSRPQLNDELLRGDATLYIRSMRSMRLQTSATGCEVAFPETPAELGSLIANCTIHETGHMLGLDTGGIDDGGHTADPNNYMWDPGSLPGGNTHVSFFFEYTVKSGDTLNVIVQRYISGTLDACRIGASDLTVGDVWQHPENKKPGFVAYPKRRVSPGRNPNDPNLIYPGEKVALINHNLRTQAYRRTFVGFLGKKSFTEDQVDRMKKFISQQLALGKN